MTNSVFQKTFLESSIAAKRKELIKDIVDRMERVEKRIIAIGVYYQKDNPELWSIKLDFPLKEDYQRFLRILHEKERK